MKTYSIDGFHIDCEEIDGEAGKLRVVGFSGEGALLDLSSIKEITQIGKKAFLSCKSLTKVILSENIHYIGDWAFGKCANLRSVLFTGKVTRNLFGKNPFVGCDKLETITFHDTEEDFSYLLAVTCNRLVNEHLLGSEELGSKSWYEKWDTVLLNYLGTEDEQSTDMMTYGEEDISFGEEDHAGEKNRCALCYLRLLYHNHLEKDKQDAIENYLRLRKFGTKAPIAWETLKEYYPNDMTYLQIYLDMIKPGREELTAMQEDLGAGMVQMKAYLINKAATAGADEDLFSDLFL